MKKTICFLLGLTALAVAGCSKSEDPEQPVSGKISIVQDSQSDYRIVYDESGTATIANEFAKALSKRTGATLSTNPASAGDAGKAIILSTKGNRILGGAKGEAYGIKMDGAKLIIEGTDANTLSQALYYFYDQFLKKTDKTSLYIDSDCSNIFDNLPPVTIKDCLSKQYSFTLANKLIGEVPPDGNIKTAQGAASDGRYYFVVMRTSDETSSVVYKYTLEPFEFVCKSEPFYAGHCNDMTYQSSKKRLYIAHGQSEGKILTPMEAATLTVLPDITITMGSGAITYDTATNRFAISQGGASLHIADDNFNKQVSYTRNDDTGYVAQGMGCDVSYVYFPMSSSKDNLLVTYNWTGAHIADIKVDIAMESESMFCVNGKYYVSFNKGGGKGAALYQVIPKITYKYL